MASIALNVVGTAIGGPIGGFIGGAIGSVIDNMIFSDTQKLPDLVGPRMADLTVQVSTYGKVVPATFGKVRIAGNVTWSQPIKETEHRETTTQGGGKGGGGKVSQTSVTYTYSATLAIAIAEGTIDEVVTIWADSKKLDAATLAKSSGKFNVHLGDETQLPDDIIGKFETAGSYPAYRGLAYVVIEDLELAEFGNRVPNFTFEVNRVVRFQPAVEDKIKAVTFIPGAGEFVYDTTIQTKTPGEQVGAAFIQKGDQVKVNKHSFEDKADVLVALDQMQKALPNLESVAVIVTWFATSTDAGTCTVIPKVEFTQGAQIKPDDWSVAGLSRGTAQSVLFFDPETPTYGGTPSDKTIMRICQELKSRGLSVMLYPMPFVDEITPDPKPWRGRIKPVNATDANEWFTKTNGYNAFIRHYSQLEIDGTHIKTLIDKFVIGSELVGMTGFTDSPGSYPAVDQFVTLAGLVKSDLGVGVDLTYAADWSEYHHADGGWFNLDPLWASAHIDFVGIDAYFPLTTDISQTQITEEKIIEGWEQDEGWDYFWNEARTVQTSFGGDPAFAWKNLQYWWENTHTNPDMAGTAWTAKMKPVIFTELGFPSVDGCANQPNVFFDPSSSESFFPRGSKGRIDFKAQREALNASLDYLATRNAMGGLGDLVPEAYIWTWDARPFPFWPDLTEVWADGGLWKTGHWINGKMGVSTLGAIIANRIDKTGTGAYDVTRLTDTVDGYIITKRGTVRQSIEQLQQAYFFDMVESDGVLKFVPRGGSPAVGTIVEDDLVPLSSSGNIRSALEITRAQELELPQKINVLYINRESGYQPGTQISQRQTVKSIDIVTINLPIVLSDQQGKIVADVTLYNNWIGRTSYKLSLPTKYVTLEPTDIVPVLVNGVTHNIRIIKTSVGRNGLMQVMGIAEDVSTYDFYTPPGQPPPNPGQGVDIADTRLELLDLPPFPSDTDPQGKLRIAMGGLGTNWVGAVLFRSDDGGTAGGNTFNQIVTQNSPAIIGNIINVLAAGSTETFDNANTMEISLIGSGTLASVTELAVLNGANVCLLGDEIIQFENATLVEPGKYKLSKLLRGRLGTEGLNTHIAGERFILLDGSVLKETMPNNLLGLTRFYRGVTIGGVLADTTEENFTYTGNTLKPFSPVHITGSRDGSLNLTIDWIRRTRLSGDWLGGVDVPLGEDTESYEIDILNGSTVVRTLTSVTPTVAYSAANQVTDFGSAQSNVDIKIYQLSAIVGRGHVGIATV